jgi:hypothetical protein
MLEIKTMLEKIISKIRHKRTKIDEIIFREN